MVGREGRVICHGEGAKRTVVEGNDFFAAGEVNDCNVGAENGPDGKREGTDYAVEGSVRIGSRGREDAAMGNGSDDERDREDLYSSNEDVERTEDYGVGLRDDCQGLTRRGDRGGGNYRRVVAVWIRGWRDERRRPRRVDPGLQDRVEERLVWEGSPRSLVWSDGRTRLASLLRAPRPVTLSSRFLAWYTSPDLSQ